MSARLFAALELPAAVRADLAAFGRAAAARDEALRPVRDDALHLTLAFLGHRALEEVEPAREAVSAVRSRSPTITLGDPLWLAPRRPRVLTVALHDDDSATLAALQTQVVERLASALPWQPEKRPFRPHATVARVRHGWRPRTRDLPEGPHATFAAEAVVLFRSHLGGRNPARYEALERVELRSQ